MRFLIVKDWHTFQHYSKRNPPWIKLYRSVLDNYLFCTLPDESKAHLMLLWIFASQNNGRIPYDPPFLETKLTCKNIDLDILIKHEFLIDSN